MIRFRICNEAVCLSLASTAASTLHTRGMDDVAGKAEHQVLKPLADMAWRFCKVHAKTTNLQ